MVGKVRTGVRFARDWTGDFPTSTPPGGQASEASIALASSSLLLRRLPPVVALLVRTGDEWAGLLRVLVEEVDAAALRAGLVARPVPGDEVALRIRGAAVERPAAARALLADVPAARLRAGDADRHRLRPLAFRVAGAGEEPPEAPALHHHRGAAVGALLVGGDVLLLLRDDLPVLAPEVHGVPALRVSRAGEELAVAPPLDDHLPFAALLADEVGLDRLGLHVPHLVLGLREVLAERLVELGEDRLPARVPLLDLVELLLHARGEGDVHLAWEGADELVRHEQAEVGGLEVLLHLLDVRLLLDGLEDGGVGGWAADAALLHLLHERGLVVAGRRLGEVLVRVELDEPELLALLERRELPLLVLLLSLARLLLRRLRAVDGEVAGELQDRAGGPEGGARHRSASAFGSGLRAGGAVAL